jgi:uncharacterized membrane protein YphA (DoxX/SURF4 family)
MNKTVTLIIRILVGLAMVVFGANKFLNFMPQPDPATIPADMMTLMGVLMSSPFMSIIGALEVAGGLALLLNKYVPLALTFIIAIMFVAMLLHLFYDSANVVGAAVFLVLSLVLVYAHKDRFASLFSA